MFRSLDSRGAPVATLRAFRSADYSVLLQIGGAMYLPRRYRSFHVVGVPLSPDYAIERHDGVHRCAGRLTSGDVSLHPAGPGERIVWPDGATCLYIHLRPALAARQADGPVDTEAMTIATHSRIRDTVVCDISKAVVALMTEPVGNATRDVARLMDALAGHIARHYLVAASRPVMLGRRRVADVLAEIRAADTTTGTVTQLARSCGLTRAHFTRRFRSITDGSPHAAVLGSRVEHAKYLLTTGPRTISEVAYATGFSDQSHLSNAFRRLIGMTPAKFRAFHALTVERVQSTNLQDRD